MKNLWMNKAAAGLILMLLPILVASEPSDVAAAYDPLTLARASVGKINNYEATVPPQCYTRTDGKANPCWTCHTASVYPNQMEDVALQEAYSFSDAANANHWSNLFLDRRAAADAISDSEILAYVRQDNYADLRLAMSKAEDYHGYVPDLDFERGFDQEGFAKDGSNWRAFRYKPFPGTFWPTNGNTDDVLIRLPEMFRSKDGVVQKGIYQINLAILEAAIAAGPEAGGDQELVYPTETLDETLVGLDLDGDGQIGSASQLRGLPPFFVGDANKVKATRYLYPKGTEFLHSVRYLDPEAPGFLARRMKELRYMRKVVKLDHWAINVRYEREYNEKEEGLVPKFPGTPLGGLLNGFGWVLQGFIEDGEGRLRLQTQEEHQACMGCHSAIGVTVDQTFALARKVPGPTGWGYQDVRGIQDQPQQGHERGEIATYLERTGGGDPFRANEEMLARFFDEKGLVREDLVAQAAVGGPRDITWLILPSPERALALDKAYRVLVQQQAFEKGRDVVLSPPKNVFRRIENGSTELATTGRVYGDGRVWLRWVP